MHKKRLIVFLDSGDTLVSEASQVYDSNEIVIKADFIPGAPEALHRIREQGYTIALVADGEIESFENVYVRQHGLRPLFDAWIISEAQGKKKPDAIMFQAAMDALKLGPEDKGRILMTGNNLSRDILGANLFGIGSVLLAWSTRYSYESRNPGETPDYVIHNPSDLPSLLELMEEAVQRGENIKDALKAAYRERPAKEPEGLSR